VNAKELPCYVGVFVPGMSEPVVLFNTTLAEGTIGGAGAMAIRWASENLIHYEIRDVWIENFMMKTAPWTGKGTSR
jgi:hypothetical protein